MRELIKNISPFNNRTKMPMALFILKKILAFWLCYILGLLISEGAVILLHFALGKNMLIGDTFDAQTITLITYYGYIIVSCVALLYWRFIEKKPLSEMELTKSLGSYLIGAIVGVLLLAVSVVAIIFTGNMEYLGRFENADIPVILLLIGGFIIQGATEEILCRGIVFHSLKGKTSLCAAIDISTLMFIIPHLPSLLEGEAIYTLFGVINLLLISTIFSLLTVRFKSIWAACGLHSFWNAALYCILGLNLSGNDNSVTAIFNIRSIGKNIWNGGEYGIEASIITAAVLAASAALIRYVCRARRKNDAALKRTDG